MDAVEFLKNVSQICSASKDCCENGCPMWEIWCKSYDKQTNETIEAIVKVVEEWAKDHPKRTRQTAFLEAFPNVEIAYGTIDILPCKLDEFLAEGCNGGEFGACAECKEAYWNEEVE